MSQKRFSKPVLAAIAAGVALTTTLLLNKVPEPQPELPPRWQQTQDILDSLTADHSSDYIYELDDLSMWTSLDAIMINSLCPTEASDPENQAFVERYQGDFLQGLFTINNIARELNRIQINLLMKDARVRAETDGELLTREQRDRVNTFTTMDDGLTVHPEDINPELLRQVQSTHPDHPVSQLSFGNVELEDRFRLLDQYWYVEEAFELNESVRCDQLSERIQQAKEGLPS